MALAAPRPSDRALSGPVRRLVGLLAFAAAFFFAAALSLAAGPWGRASAHAPLLVRPATSGEQRLCAAPRLAEKMRGHRGPLVRVSLLGGTGERADRPDAPPSASPALRDHALDLAALVPPSSLVPAAVTRLRLEADLDRVAAQHHRAPSSAEPRPAHLARGPPPRSC